MTTENLKRGWELLDLIKGKKIRIAQIANADDFVVGFGNEMEKSCRFSIGGIIDEFETLIDFTPYKAKVLAKLNIELAELEKEFDEL